MPKQVISNTSGSSTFIGLTDTPANYPNVRRFLTLSPGGVGVEFFDLSYGVINASGGQTVQSNNASTPVVFNDTGSDSGVITSNLTNNSLVLGQGGTYIIQGGTEAEFQFLSGNVPPTVAEYFTVRLRLVSTGGINRPLYENTIVIPPNRAINPFSYYGGEIIVIPDNAELNLIWEMDVPATNAPFTAILNNPSLGAVLQGF